MVKNSKKYDIRMGSKSIVGKTILRFRWICLNRLNQLASRLVLSHVRWSWIIWGLLHLNTVWWRNWLNEPLFLKAIRLYCHYICMLDILYSLTWQKITYFNVSNRLNHFVTQYFLQFVYNLSTNFASVTKIWESSPTCHLCRNYKYHYLADFLLRFF